MRSERQRIPNNAMGKDFSTLTVNVEDGRQA